MLSVNEDKVAVVFSDMHDKNVLTDIKVQEGHSADSSSSERFFEKAERRM